MSVVHESFTIVMGLKSAMNHLGPLNRCTKLMQRNIECAIITQHFDVPSSLGMIQDGYEEQ
jgi:hypothetical protein